LEDAAIAYSPPTHPQKRHCYLAYIVLNIVPVTLNNFKEMIEVCLQALIVGSGSKNAISRIHNIAYVVITDVYYRPVALD